MEPPELESESEAAALAEPRSVHWREVPSQVEDQPPTNFHTHIDTQRERERESGAAAGAPSLDGCVCVCVCVCVFLFNAEERVQPRSREREREREKEGKKSSGRKTLKVFEHKAMDGCRFEARFKRSNSTQFLHTLYIHCTVQIYIYIYVVPRPCIIVMSGVVFPAHSRGRPAGLELMAHHANTRTNTGLIGRNIVIVVSNILNRIRNFHLPRAYSVYIY